MKQTVDVLVIEDNEYFNNLIFNALQQSTHFVQTKFMYKLVLHSFVDSVNCLRKIESREFNDNDVVAFVDSKMDNGVSGAQIIKLLKKENSNTLAVLLSQSRVTEERSMQNNYDFVVIKDTFAPALCRLYLDQFIENKFL
jgi:CheY-like chemotaxis protein